MSTRTDSRREMAEFVREVLGLQPTPVDGMDAEMFALPDRSSFAVTSPDGPSDTQRYIHFRAPDGHLYELVEPIG
ncbi:MAG TPA: hypothetical protein VFD59_11890 [Nocardioidaceae bacterium]|nr:hypothetical protein [Nocardioidaceae bacterium]